MTSPWMGSRPALLPPSEMKCSCSGSRLRISSVALRVKSGSPVGVLLMREAMASWWMGPAHARLRMRAVERIRAVFMLLVLARSIYLMMNYEIADCFLYATNSPRLNHGMYQCARVIPLVMANQGSVG